MNIYKIRNENMVIPIKKNTDLSLYNACKGISRVIGGIVLRGDKKSLIAYFNPLENRVKPGFGANDIERDMIKDYSL